MQKHMAPVRRGETRKAAPSRRAATAPAQSRRTAAAKPTRRQAAEEPEEAETKFDAAADGDDEEEDDEEEYDEDNLPQVIDLSDVKATTYEVIPKGRYEGWVESIEYGLSQSKGLPMLTWVLKLNYGEDDDGEPIERTLRYYTTLAGEGAGRTKATLARLDPELDLSKIVPDEMEDRFADMDIMIGVTIRPDREDRKIKRNNVSDIWPLEAEDD